MKLDTSMCLEKRNTAVFKISDIQLSFLRVCVCICVSSVPPAPFYFFNFLQSSPIKDLLTNGTLHARYLVLHDILLQVPLTLF